jgi:hypothetical protein
VSGRGNSSLRRQRRQALSDGNRVQKELDDAIAVELLLELGITPDGRHDGLDDATRAAALERTRALIKDKAPEMVRLYRIALPPPQPAQADDDRPRPTPEIADEEARWRVVAGLAAGPPPRPEIAEPRGRGRLEPSAAGLKSISRSARTESDLTSDILGNASTARKDEP